MCVWWFGVRVWFVCVVGVSVWRKDPQKSKKTRLPTVSCLNNSMHRGVSNHTQPGPEKTSALSVIIAQLWALKVIANSKLGVSQFTKFRAAFCHCVAPCPCFASCNCCHAPFIVRSAQICPPFTGVTQLAHPSRCSRSTMTTVCFCARASFRVSVFTSGLQPRHQLHQRLVTFIL